MAKILKFSLLSKSSTPPRQPLDGGAQIVIFPGVRYEYWGRNETSENSPRERDRLVLAE